MGKREEQIATNFTKVKERLVTAAVRHSRDPESIRLVAVSKTREALDILAAYNCGLREFGENRVQEALGKVSELPEDITWHLIGQLQRNKARKAVEFAALIHSLDRLSLGKTLNRLGEEMGKPVHVLVEVNTSGEDSKVGLEPTELERFLYQLQELEWLKVKGLMTVAPYVEDSQKARVYFAKLRELFDQAKTFKLPNADMQVLSMGMTNDYESAIAEGATLVRIGQGIFGPRIS